MANGFQLSQQVQVGGIPQHRVSALADDLGNLFGAVTKGAEKYAQVGEQAAKLEFNSLYQDVLAKHDALKQEAMKLKDDDVEGHLWVAEQAKEIQSVFSKKLPDFEYNEIAYNAFKDASAGALHQLQGYNLDFLKSSQTASKIRSYNMVDESSKIGLKATKESFDTNVAQLAIVADTEQKGFEDAQKLLFGHAWSAISNNANSVSKFDAVTELMDQNVGGVTFSSHEKVAEFMNRRILQNSETAKIIVTEKDGVKTFGVEGLFNDDQNAKIVALADSYISMMQKPEGDKDYWIGLKELKSTVGDIISENLAQMSASSSSEAWSRVKQLTEKYLATPEGQNLATDPNKLFEFHETLSNVNKAGSRKDAMMRIAENPDALLKLKSGDGEMYSYITPKGFKDGVTQCSPEAVANGQCQQLALKQGDLSDITNYLQGEINIAKTSDPVKANRLERILSNVTDTKSPAKSIADNINAGRIPYRTKAEAENALALLDSNEAELSKSEYNSARKILSDVITTYDKDGVITPNTVRAVNNGAKREKLDNIDNGMKKEVNVAVNKVFFGDNRTPLAVTDFVYDKLLRERKFDPRVDNADQIAELIKNNTILVDFDGKRNTRIPMLGTLNEDVATKGFKNFLNRMGKERKYGIKFDPENVSILPSQDGQGYVVNWKNAKDQWAGGMKLTPEMVYEYSVSKKWK